MASVLSQQLQQLAVAAGVRTTKVVPRGRASLLWTPHEAADIDAETVLALSRTALLSLSSRDARYARFQEVLYGKGTLTLDPSDLEAPALAALDEAALALARLLCDDLLSPEAPRALEWLIRRFRVNERRAESLLVALLPHHDAAIFARLVQVCDLGGTRFSFLEPARKSGVPPSRHLLVERAVNDPALFALACAGATAAGSADVASRLYPPFYAVFASAVLASGRAPSGSQEPRAAAGARATAWLPHLRDHLAPGLSDDLAAAALVALAALAAAVPLPAKVADAAAEAVAARLAASPSGPARAPAALRALAVVAATRPSARDAAWALPAPAVLDLARACAAAAPDEPRPAAEPLAAELAELARRSPGADALAAAVVAGAAAALAGDASPEAPGVGSLAALLERIASAVPMRPEAAALSARAILAASIEGVGTAEARAALLALAAGSPAACAALAAAARSRPAGGAAATVRGTGLEPAPRGARGTLLDAAGASDAALRRAAAARVAEIATGAGRTDEASALVRDALPRLLDDPSLPVVEAALAPAALGLLPPLARGDPLSAALERALSGVFAVSAEGPERKAARRTAALALGGLGALAAELGDAPADASLRPLAAACAALALSEALGAKGKKLRLAASRAAAALAVPAGVDGLAESEEPAARQAGGQTEAADASPVKGKKGGSAPPPAATPAASTTAVARAAAASPALAEALLAASASPPALLASGAGALAALAISAGAAELAERVLASACETASAGAAGAAALPAPSASPEPLLLEGAPSRDVALSEGDLTLAASGRASGAALSSSLLLAALRARAARPAAAEATPLAPELLLSAALAAPAAASGRAALAAAAVSALGARRARAACLAVASNGSTPADLRAAAAAAWALSEPIAEDELPLVALASDPEEAVRRGALAALAAVPSPSALASETLAAAEAVVADEAAAVAAAARAAGGRAAPSKAARARLIAALRAAPDASPAPVRLLALRALCPPAPTATPEDAALAAAQGARLAAALGDADGLAAEALAGPLGPASAATRAPSTALAAAVAAAALAALEPALRAQPPVPARGAREGAASTPSPAVPPATPLASPAARADTDTVPAASASSGVDAPPPAAPARPPPATRAAAAAAVSAAVFSACPPPARSRLAAALGLAASRDEDTGVRAAAAGSLSAIPDGAEIVAGLLVGSARAQSAGPATPSPAKRGRRGAAAAEGSADAAAPSAAGLLSSPEADALRRCEAALEALHWLPAPEDPRAVRAALAGVARAADAAAASAASWPAEAPEPQFLARLAVSALATQLERDAEAAATAGAARALASQEARLAPSIEAAAALAAASAAPATRAEARRALRAAVRLAPATSLREALAALAARPAGAARDLAAARASASELLRAVAPAAAEAAAEDLPAFLRALVATLASLSPPERLALCGTVLEALGSRPSSLLDLVRSLLAEAARPGSGWAADLATAVLFESTTLERARALAYLVRETGDRALPPLFLAALELAAAAARREANQLARGSGAASPPEAYEPLLEAALEATRAVAEAEGDAEGVVGAPLAAASKASRSLLDACRDLLAPAPYARALCLSASTGPERARRRALARLAAAAPAAGADADAGAVAAVAEALPAIVRAAAAAAAAQPEPASPGSAAALLLQQALATAGAFAGPMAAGGRLGEAAELLTAALGAAGDPSRTVRASALAAAAAAAAPLGPRVLPNLSAAVATALASTSSEDPLVQAAAHALLKALVEAAGPLLAPSLPSILAALLDVDLGGAAAGAAQAARTRLLRAVPPRLLLPALLGRCGDAAAAAGRPATLAALALVVPRLGTRELADAAEPIFRGILAALDAGAGDDALLDDEPAEDAEGGSAPPPSLRLLEARRLLEAAALEALRALVLRLSEKRFDPLFRSALAWAGESVSPARRVARSLALLSICNGLCDELRSVFGPYVSAALGVTLRATHWSAEAAEAAAGAGSAKRATKKARRGGADGAPPAAAWVASLRAVRVLHAGIKHDTDPPRFADADAGPRILPALAGALSAVPPSAAARAAVEAEPGAREGHWPDPADARAGALQRAGAAALAALASRPGAPADAAKAAHAAALEASRAGRGPARLAALAAVSALASALGDEYLALLPEALPHLAERLEDSDPAVVARAQRLFKQLEDLSGEDLEQYLKA